MVDFERARTGMVNGQVRTSSITDRKLLNVMGEVPRELFVPEARRELAYIDEAHQLSEGSSPRLLAAPAPFAKLIQLGSIEPEDEILDVGCGTGYSTAVLAHLGRRVVGIDTDPDLISKAKENLAALGLNNAEVVEGEVGNGMAGQLFDVIVLEGAVETVPETLFGQLRDGGRLIAMLSRGNVAVAHLYVRSGKDVAARAEFNASLPALDMAKRPDEFVF